MIYAPHILQKRITPLEQTDSTGKPVVVQTAPEWVTVCRCRCDFASDDELVDDNGEMFRPTHHVVCEGNGIDIASGDYVRVMHGDIIKASGRAKKPNKLNYLPYAEIYL